MPTFTLEHTLLVVGTEGQTAGENLGLYYYGRIKFLKVGVLKKWRCLHITGLTCGADLDLEHTPVVVGTEGQTADEILDSTIMIE